MLFVFVKSTCEISWSGSYTIDQAFECINSVVVDQQWKEQIIETTKAYLEPYIYTDILKAPPIIKGHDDYFLQVDIINELDKIKNNNNLVNFYEIFQEIKRILTKCRDGHLGFSLVSNTNYNYYIEKMIFVLPGTFKISGESDVYFNPRTFGVDYPQPIPNDIFENSNKKVIEINGENPLEFIQNFGDTYEDSKSPHARFTQALETISGSILSFCPLNKEVLDDGLNITYEDNTIINVKYIILYNSNGFNQRMIKGIKKNLGKVTKDIHPLQHTYNYILEEIKRQESAENKKSGEDNGYFSSDRCIRCGTLNDRKVNVLIISSFKTNDENSFISTEWKCMELFDSNDYPIIIILPHNGGGSGPFAMDLVNGLSKSPTFETSSFKITNTSEYLARLVYCGTNKDPQTCEPRCGMFSLNLGDWYNKPTTIEYIDQSGNKYEHVVTQLSKLEYDYKKEQRLRELKNKRDPTEIIIFTDGYCYSACSVFVKSMKENGAAIVVGYGGNPNSKYDDVFDDGQSPANVLDDDIFDVIFNYYSNYKQYIKLREYLGISMSISCLETFEKNFKFDETIPREFIVEQVDERIKTIHKYSDDDLDSFIEEGLNIIKKYKTKCNYNNEKLVKMDDSCNSNNTEGGFICGKNNEWTNECKTTMCSNKNYIYNTNENKCIDNTCYKCNVKNCEECDINSKDYCSKCENGYGISNEINPIECKKFVCDSGCETCKNDNDCEICKKGYFLEKGECKECINHCDECSDSLTCSKCSNMYETDDNGKVCVLKPETYDIAEIVLLCILILLGIIILIVTIVTIIYLLCK